MYKIITYLFFFSVLVNFAKAGKQDSIAIEQVQFSQDYTISNVINKNDSISEFHYYTNFRNDYTLNKGYLGGRTFSFAPLIKNSPLFHAEDYLLKRNPIFKSKVPVTEVFYMNTPNSGKEQFFDIFHTQKFLNIIGLNFSWNKSKAIGDYSEQESLSNNLQSNLYYSRSNFSTLLSYDFDKLDDTENGGVLFNSDAIDFKPAMDIWLSEAFSLRKNHRINYSQAYGIWESQIDSVSDSYKALYLFTNLSYENNLRQYFDSDSLSAYYNNSLDSAIEYSSQRISGLIFDSTLTNKFIGQLGISNINVLENLSNSTASRQKIRYSINYSYEKFSYLQNSFNKISYNSMISGMVDYSVNDNLSGKGDFKYTFFGQNSGDLTSKFRLDYIPVDSCDYSLNLVGMFTSLQPSFYYLKYRSNQVQWDRSYQQISTTMLKVHYDNKKYRTYVDFGLYSIKNYTFFNEYAFTEQYDASISLVDVVIQKKNTLLKAFNIDLEGRFMYSSFEDIYPVPSMSTKFSVYYQNYIFNKGMLVNLGIDGYYFSRYTAKTFSPLLGELYLQQEELIGGYPYLDVFVNAQIKNARIFLKVSHFNSDLMNANYYYIQGYPVRERMIQVGLNWKFYH